MSLLVSRLPELIPQYAGHCLTSLIRTLKPTYSCPSLHLRILSFLNCLSSFDVRSPNTLSRLELLKASGSWETA